MSTKSQTMEFFIERVRNNPCLWNTNHVSFRDVVRKDMTWTILAKECGMVSGREAKCQWKKIRDSHREALRRRKNSMTAQTFRPWKFEEEMKFLLTNSDNGEISSYGIDIQDNAYDNYTETNNTPIESYCTPEPPLSPVSSEPETKSIKILEERQKMHDQVKVDREEARRHVVDMNRFPQDALSSLFNSFCQKTRELPKYLQLRVQREVFESIMRAEEEALSYESRSSYTSPLSGVYENASTNYQNDGVVDVKPNINVNDSTI